MLLSTQLEQNEYDFNVLLCQNQRLIIHTSFCLTQHNVLHYLPYPLFKLALVKSNTFPSVPLNSTSSQEQHLSTHTRRKRLLKYLTHPKQPHPQSFHTTLRRY